MAFVLIVLLLRDRCRDFMKVNSGSKPSLGGKNATRTLAESLLRRVPHSKPRYAALEFRRDPELAGAACRQNGCAVSKIGKISKLLQIFGGLVLGCIKTKFRKKICV